LVCEKNLVENSEHENLLFFEECDAVDGGWGVLGVKYVTESLCIGHCLRFTVPCVELVVMLE
jgi:hypothetical protein